MDQHATPENPVQVTDTALDPDRRHASGTRVLLAGLAGVTALWFGLTAPAVSPVAPAAQTAVVQDAREGGGRLSVDLDGGRDGRRGGRGDR